MSAWATEIGLFLPKLISAWVETDIQSTEAVPMFDLDCGRTIKRRGSGLLDYRIFLRVEIISTIRLFRFCYPCMGSRGCSRSDRRPVSERVGPEEGE